jgi:hypothetical protein
MSGAARDLDALTFDEEFALELRDQKRARLHYVAGELCAEGDCENGHRLYHKIIASQPDSLLSIQCYTALLMCCEQSNAADADADAARKALIAAGERMLAHRPRAAWTCDLCCLVGAICLRVSEPSQNYISKAEEILARCRAGHMGSPRWQCSELEGRIHERRGQWSDAVRVYRQVLSDVDTPQRWYFQIRLSEALMGYARELAPETSSNGRLPCPVSETAATLRECARAILEPIAIDPSIDKGCRKLAKESLETLYAEVTTSQVMGDTDHVR